MTRYACLLWLAGLACAAAQEPLLYLPFDGDVQPAADAAPGARIKAGDDLSFVAGLRGRAAHIATDLRLARGKRFRVAAGTLAFWLRPAWAGADRKSRYLFCLYGHHSLKDPWRRNRWSLHAGGGKLRFWIVGDEPSNSIALEADIRAWRPGEWRSIALTWSGINSGRADAVLRLFVDGRLAAERRGARLTVGRVGDWIDIGRDSDASPDYADADYDEFYIYDRALSPAQIARAVALARAAAGTPIPPAPKPRPVPYWADANRPFRCRVLVTAVGSKAAVAARLPLDLQRDLNALGLRAVVEPGSLWLTRAEERTPLPFKLENDALLWRVPGDRPTAYDVYFAAARLDVSTPLFARWARRAWPHPPQATVPLPDYATDTYGDAWDFDEGDFECIDQWGNRPWCLRNKKVERGVLSMDVSEDPWFIWGNMWGQIDRAKRRVAIDLSKYPILKMRVRQSCPEAKWEIYGRTSGPRLRTYKFKVRGQGWQVVRIDLVRQARWSGVLRAFRIDPTAGVKRAHVEIDWVRLTNEAPATRRPVQVLPPQGRAVARLQVEVERTRVRVGSRQRVVVTAFDTAGRPAAGCPVTLRLLSSSDGRLEATQEHRTLRLRDAVRRGITDASGRVTVVIVHGSKPGRRCEPLVAEADFTTVHAISPLFELLRGLAHHYRVTPTKAVCLPVSRFPLQIEAQLVDALNNPVPAAGRVVRFFAPPGGTLSPPQATTDARGRARATLTVDPAKRWVYRVDARDDSGLAGRSAAISISYDRPKRNPIRLLPNGYFAYADGRPFVPLGGFYANWVHAPTPDGEWDKRISFTDATDEQKRRWMKFLADHGVTAMRFMLRTHRREGMEPMDVCGRVNRPLFAEALRYMDLAREFGLKFQLVVHEDYVKPAYFNLKHLRLFVLPQYAGEDLDALPAFQRRFVRDQRLIRDIGEKYTDPDVIACQDQYALELAEYLRGNPQVFAYELENEMVACPASWANHAVDVLHAADPQTLVCASHGGGGLRTADPLWWLRRTRIDFYNYHLYPHGTTSPAMDYGAVADVLTRYGRMAGRCLFGECVGDQFRLMKSVERRRWVVRDLIWLALTNGNPGVFFWNALGSEVREFKMAKDAMAQLDLATFRRARPRIGIDVRHPLDHDLYYRTAQGRKDLAMMGRYAQHYLSLGVDFDFTFEPARYPLRATLKEFKPPMPARRYFTFGPGWQLAYLARPDWSEALIYVRNFAGVELWECRVRGPQPWKQYLRKRAPAELHLRLNLPEGVYAARVYDLDEQSVSTREARFNGRLDFGRADHDFAIVLKRR